MTEFQNTEELREFILNRQELDEDVLGVSGQCWGLAWKKDRWAVRVDNKRVAEITAANVPKGFDLRNEEFSYKILSTLRKDGLLGLEQLLKEIKNAK